MRAVSRQRQAGVAGPRRFFEGFDQSSSGGKVELAWGDRWRRRMARD
ncbi:hypothetical protein GS506_15955 [Rhodococcus hoagii]|nr:hypothetical protein [Prescottella equi]